MSDIKVVRRPSPEPDDSATQLRDAEAEKLVLGDVLLRPEQVPKYIEAGLRPDLFAHPINQSARNSIQEAILSAYAQEFEYSKQEGYVATEFKDMDYDSWGEYTAS